MKQLLKKKIIDSPAVQKEIEKGQEKATEKSKVEMNKNNDKTVKNDNTKIETSPSGKEN